MKTKIKVGVIVLLMIITSATFTRPASAQQAYVSFQVFYDQLSPYGDWVSTPQYDYIWVPNIGPDFSPYSTEGRWILTSYGWTWLSYYDWGWAPFHYGRWDYDNYYGWFWIPDNEWGPAWVSWRRGEGYYGWEPMGPGISITMSFGNQYDNHNDHWIFVRDRDLNRPDIDRYYVNRSDNDRIIRNSNIINNTYVDDRRNTTYVTGPAREDIQRVIGKSINPIVVQEFDKPGQDLSKDNVRFYMPRVTKSNDDSRRSAPSNITRREDVKQPRERNVSNQLSRPDSRGSAVQDKQSNQYSPQKNQNNVETDQPKNTKINPIRNEGKEQQQSNTTREQKKNAVRELQNNGGNEKQNNIIIEKQNNAVIERQNNAAKEKTIKLPMNSIVIVHNTPVYEL